MAKVKVKLVPEVKDGVIFNSVSDKVGSYFNDKIDNFKKRMFFYLDKVLDVVYDVEDLVNDKIDGVVGKVIDCIEEEKYKKEVNKKEKERRLRMEFVMSLIADDSEFDEQITEMKEFEEELGMDNFRDKFENNVGKRR